MGNERDAIGSIKIWVFGQTWQETERLAKRCISQLPLLKLKLHA